MVVLPATSIHDKFTERRRQRLLALGVSPADPLLFDQEIDQLAPDLDTARDFLGNHDGDRLEPAAVVGPVLPVDGIGLPPVVRDAGVFELIVRLLVPAATAGRSLTKTGR